MLHDSVRNPPDLSVGRFKPVVDGLRTFADALRPVAEAVQAFGVTMEEASQLMVATGRALGTGMAHAGRRFALSCPHCGGDLYGTVDYKRASRWFSCARCAFKLELTDAEIADAPPGAIGDKLIARLREIGAEAEPVRAERAEAERVADAERKRVEEQQRQEALADAERRLEQPEPLPPNPRIEKIEL